VLLAKSGLASRDIPHAGKIFGGVTVKSSTNEEEDWHGVLRRWKRGKNQKKIVRNMLRKRT